MSNIRRSDRHTTPLASPPSSVASESADSQFTRILRSWVNDLGDFSNYALLDLPDKSFQRTETYNGSDICKLQVGTDEDRLDEEFILALGIRSGFLLHRL